jgi:hypothetical protein
VVATSVNVKAQNWLQGLNTIPTGQSNRIGTTSGSATSLRNFIIATNSVNRITVSGSIFQTTFQGNTSVFVNTNNTGIGNVSSNGDLGLFAGSPFCISLGAKTAAGDPDVIGSATSSTIGPAPTSGPGDNIIMAARSMFLQSKNVVPGGFAPIGPHRVFIGERTDITLNAFLPKLLVRGGGTVEASVCGSTFNDADNIGLVSEGNFGESPASTNPNKWISLGSRPTNANAEFNNYGYRAQWNQYAADLAVQNQASGTVKDVSLTWQDGSATAAPNATTFTSANSLLVQFRNGTVPTAISANARRTVAKFSVASGAGLLEVSGSVIQNAALLASDMRLKKDIEKINNSLDIINQLNPVKYNYKTEEFSEFGLPNYLQYGFLAQEVEKVLPTHVQNSTSGYKAVNYVMLIPILTKAIQEGNTLQQQTQARVIALEKQLENVVKENQLLNEQLERKGVLSATDTKSDLTNQFFQNQPNPFSETTTIAYKFKNEGVYQIMVTDLTGKLIKRFDGLKGQGEVVLTKNDLPAAGIYSYTLINSTNEVIASKQLVFQN